MKISKDLVKNDVPATGQVKESDCVLFEIKKNADIKILFLGNSITLHGKAENIGWNGDWGMAASCKENDYVHQLIKLFEGRGQKVSYCLANLSQWEQSWNDNILYDEYLSARDFSADIVIVRLGENARLLDRVDEFASHYKVLINFFARHDTKVVLTDLFWEYEPFDIFVEKLARENGYALAQIHDLGSIEEMKAIGQFSHEGVAAHPSDKGMKEIANRIFDAICNREKQ